MLVLGSGDWGFEDSGDKILLFFIICLNTILKFFICFNFWPV